MARIALDNAALQKLYVIPPTDPSITTVVDEWTGGGTASGATLETDVHDLVDSGKVARLPSDGSQVTLTISATDISGGSRGLGLWAYNAFTSDVSMIIYVTGDNFASYANIVVAIPPGAHYVDLHSPKRFATGGGFSWASDAAAITKIRVKTVDANVHPTGTGVNEGGGGYLDVGKIIFGVRQKAVLLLMQDDSYTTCVNNGSGYPTGYPASGGNVKDIVESYGYKFSVATIAGTNVIAGKTDDQLRRVDGGSNWLTSGECRTLVNAGHSLVVHGNADWNGLNSTEGFRILGPDGNALEVSSVDTGTDVITMSANCPFRTGEPVTLSGTDLPAPLETDTIYYFIEGAGATQLQLATTYANAVATTAIDLTTAGTAANFTLSHAYGAADESAIVACIEDCQNWLGSLGVKTETTALVWSGGGNDYWCALAARQCGIEYARTTQGTAAGVWGNHGSDVYCRTGINPTNGDDAFYPNKGIARPYDTDSATVTNDLDNAIADGLVIAAYGHGIDATKATNLDAVCAYAQAKERQGLLEVLSVGEYLDLVSAVRRISATTGRISA